MKEFDIDVTRLETALAQEESGLHTELAKLSTVAAEIQRRVSDAAALVSQAEALGTSDAALSAKLRELAPRPMDADATLARAREARNLAVKARREANDQLKQQLTAWKSELTRLAMKVQQEEKEAHRLSEHARAMAAEAEQKQAARLDADARAAEAARTQAAAKAAPAPPPVPRPTQAERPRRHMQRVKMQAAVDLHSDANFFNGFSADISDGGLFIATVAHVAIGTEVDLDFSLPGGQKVKARGVVRWVREVDDRHHDQFPGLGVQFVDLDPMAADAIHRFVSSREPMFYVDG